MSDLMTSLTNLLVLALTFGLVITIKRLLGGRNFAAALLSTITIVVGSVFLFTSGIGYGGWLMATLPLSPIILGVLWIAFFISDLVGGKSARPMQMETMK